MDVDDNGAVVESRPVSRTTNGLMFESSDRRALPLGFSSPPTARVLAKSPGNNIASDLRSYNVYHVHSVSTSCRLTDSAFI